MTCGESRFVFTVINALCNSLKIIKEAEVFFFFPSVALQMHFLHGGRHVIFTTVHQQSCFIMVWLLGTVVGISGRQFTQ